MRARGALIAAAALLICLSGAVRCPARAYQPPGDHLFAGVSGGSSIAAFQHDTGKHPPVFEYYVTWRTSTAFLRGADPAFRSRIGIELGTSPGYGEAGVITPEQIALGNGDRFLAALGANLAHSRRIFYLRLMGEMNGYWNAYAAFAASGASRGTQNSPHFIVQAWRRTVLILRGGSTALIDAKLRRLGLPGLNLGARPPARLAQPKVAFLWVPQDAGSPEIAANAPAAFWPGADYVDWVGTDFYASYPNYSLLDAFYRRFSGKPFVFSEYALYGADDPGFVRGLFAWIAAHPRVRMLNYYQGFTASAKPSLTHYPRSRAALRAALRSRRFLAYPPEYAKPRHGASGPPSNPAPGGGPTQPAPGPPVAPVPVSPPSLCLPLVAVCVPGL